MEPVHPQRPSTWKKFKNGMCVGCHGYCCALPVEASMRDLIRLELVSEEEAMDSPKRVARRLEKSGVIQSYREKTGVFVLEQKSNDDCIYLGKDRLCTVYEKRPEVCRQFPKIGPRPGWCPEKRKSQN